ncbi:hypothetical protein HYH03_014361 [Edaphochlamys debaryana]|uniref:Uncharacterized protein n=1 Tax=Edaphochlamys debaryana TaxID=47281 RepID=A0A835XNV7_9CHLO|nr:hypothetical protein HYH03_014361 [Edaphochlamys debaryana]|eukprot:KAG2486989.1 hypothetical protein HYH03_014361 [Edaphochlamys debaryana]
MATRRDIEDLIKQLQVAEQHASGGASVLVDAPLFSQAVEALGRLEQALDNRPSLIKKLNEKIMKLESELETLRSATRVDELERKIQRLEGELQRSYATKNFTLKNGLLEIEKAYRDFITASPAVQSLWDEITLLLVEDKESAPSHILARRNQHAARVAEAAAEAVAAAAAATAAAAAGTTPIMGPGGEPLDHPTSYVQQQVDKFKDYTFTPGTLDPAHPAPSGPGYAHPHYFPGHAGQPGSFWEADARAIEQPNDDRPLGLDTDALREQYDRVGTAAEGAVPRMQYDTLVPPGPSPLRPVSLFGAGADRAPDASALDAARDELHASLDQLRTMFAPYTWAPTPLAAAAGTAGAGPGAAAGAEGGGGGAAGEAGARAPPDAAAFETMAESLEVSVARLREYFSRMGWAPGAAAGPGGSSAAAGASGEGVTPDARALDAQADAILSSIQHLRAQFQAAAAARAAAAGDGGAASDGDGAAGRAAVVPDARYFETQADSIAASLDELMRLYSRSSNDLTFPTVNGRGPGGSWASPSTAGLAPGSSGVLPPGAAPDARAGDVAGDVGSASVQPMVDLFSSFLAHLQATQGGSGPGGPWAWAGGAGPAPPGGSGGAGEGAEGAEGAGPSGDGTGEAASVAGSRQQQQLQPADLVRMFAAYARAWPTAAAAGRAAVVVGGGGSTAGGGGGGVGSAGASVRLSPSPSPSGDYDLSYGGAGGGGGGGGAGGLGAGGGGVSFGGFGSLPPLPPAAPPPVRFRISINTSEAAAGGTLNAHLSPIPSTAAFVLGDADGGTPAAAGTPLTPSASSTPYAPNGGGAAGTSFPAAASAAAATPAGSAAAGSGDAGAATLGSAAAAAAAPGSTSASGKKSGKRAASRASTASAAPGAAAVDILLASLESKHGKGLTTSPDAVAVWRDLLTLLGVDPDSRPIPRSGTGALASSSTRTAGAAAGSGAGAGAGSGSGSGGAHLGAAGGTAEGEAEAAGGEAAATEKKKKKKKKKRRKKGGAAGAEAEGAEGNAGGVENGEGGEAGAAGEAGGSGAGGEGGAVRVARSRAAAGGEEAEAAEVDEEEWVSRGEGSDYEDDWEDDEGEEGEEAAVTKRSAAAAGASAGSGGARAGGDGGAAGGLGGGAGEGEGTAGSTAGGAAGAGAGAFAASNGAADGGAQGQQGEAAEAAAEGAGGAGGASAAPRLVRSASAAAALAAAAAAASPYGESPDVAVSGAADPHAAAAASGPFGSASGSDAGTGSDVDDADGGAVEAGPGLVAGGVRFQITLSEIAAAPEEQPAVQFRANVAEGPRGADPAQLERAEAEVMQLKLLRHSLSEQLGATQELVTHLNRQLKGVLEEREDLAARAERLSSELGAARSAASEARSESDHFMRELVDTKVQLAEVQGEYMQVYQALKRALGNEKGMMAKIEELERILAVVGPGDVAYDDEYEDAVRSTAAGHGGSGGGVARSGSAPRSTAELAAAAAADAKAAAGVGVGRRG